MRKAFILLCLCSFTCFAQYTCTPENPCPTEDPCDSCRSCDPCYVPCIKIKKTPGPCTPAYNAPYKIEVACPWDTYVSASYILWQAQMDNTQFGDIQTTTIDDFDLSLLANQTVCRDRLDVDQKYQSGFKAGLGFICNCDMWDFFLEYTYLRSCASRKTSIANEAFSISNSVTTEKYINGYFFTDCINQTALLGENENFIPFTASGNWTVDLDMGDAELARMYYVGKALLFRPFAGLRLAFIRQSYLAKYEGPVAPSVSQAFNVPQENGQFTFQNTNAVESWGLGPRMGIDMSWVFCGNFRAFTDFSASILYTRYYKQQAQSECNIYDQQGSLVVQSGNKQAEKHTFCALRPETDCTFGLAWGCDFECSRWYFDLSAGYSFAVFWDQNLFYQGVEEYVRNTEGTPGTVMEKTNNLLNLRGGNLYYQGLTITLDMHF